MMKIFKEGIPIFPVLVFLVFISWVTVMYSQGYRLNFNKKQVKVTQTGILSVRSIPEGAKIYLNDQITTATNSTISSLAPGSYKVSLKKEGFTEWKKTVIVYNDKVTDITALLISQSPRIEPLTNYGVSTFAMSNDGTKIAYATKNGKEPGIWLLPLTGPASISIFSGNRNRVIADSSSIAYSLAEGLEWSPDDKEILVKINKERYFLVSLSGSQNINPESFSDPIPTYNAWKLQKEELLTKYLEKLQIPDEILSLAKSPDAIWSPDFRKFMIKKSVEKEKLTFEIYNFEDPLPVGEERKYTPLTIGTKDPVNVSWYSDSYHLVIVDGSTIEIIRVDGSNRTEIFTGNLLSNLVFPTPSGDKVIVLSSFKQSAPGDLYTISLR